MKVDIQEQCPYVVAEALSCGKPVIATNVGGISEVVGDAGILCTPGDYIQLAEAIKHLVENEHVRNKLSKIARERAEKLFSCKVNTPKLLDLISTLR